MPNNIAAKSKNYQITYRELDSLASNVAATLQMVGVMKGDRVGIYLPKSVSSLISIYSVLKCGAAYVPFDPDAPPERLALIAKDCDIKALLSCSSKKKGVQQMVSKGATPNYLSNVEFDLPAVSGLNDESRVPNVAEVGWDEALSHNDPLSVQAISETDPAYILYTSGSTGVPKGVTISHKNSLAFVNWAADKVGLVDKDVVACHAPLHFDISIFSIFSTCKAGGKVALIPERASTFPTELAGMLKLDGITVWYSVPSALTLLALYGNLENQDLTKLRTIIFAGEVFPVKFLRMLMIAIPNARYLNWYGPTETNVCTSYEVQSTVGSSAPPVPIGKAASGDEVFAIAEDGNLVNRPGEIGELCVRGPTVMVGYWGDPDRTNRLLVQDPLNQASSGRVYRTGDLVTLDNEENFVYLGRHDGMIKTRGFRVELGDVETALYAHPNVKETVVVPIPDELVGNRIHAFISLNQGTSVTREEILHFCSSKLPRYMVPDSVQFMASLPKTSSGKMDRVTLAQSIGKS